MKSSVLQIFMVMPFHIIRRRYRHRRRRHCHRHRWTENEETIQNIVNLMKNLGYTFKKTYVLLKDIAKSPNVGFLGELRTP